MSETIIDIRPKIDIRVLNVGEGDLKVTFDPNSPQEKDNAKKMIGDLLKQGFAIMIQTGTNEKGPTYQRVKRFDPKTCEYIVMGTPTPVTKEPTRRGRRQQTRVPASRTPVVAVARSAGGYDPLLIDRIKRYADPRAIEVKL